MATMKQLINRMFGEKEDFYTYMEMFEESKDPTYIKLAEGEGDDYKTLYDIVFKDAPSTPKEEALQDYACMVYEKMKEHIVEAKGAK